MSVDTREDFYTLTSATIARIHDALHDLKDGSLHRICMDILWERHGVEGGEWSLSESEIGPITLMVGEERRVLQPRDTHHVLRRYCCTVRDSKPLDPAHRLARRLHFSFLDCDGKQRVLDHEQCLCGARSDLPMGQGGLVTGQHRIGWGLPSAHVWPQTTIPGVNDGRPVLVVCKRSQGAQDPLHAPGLVGDRCICGASLGIWNTTIDQYLPVQ